MKLHWRSVRTSARAAAVLGAFAVFVLSISGQCVASGLTASGRASAEYEVKAAFLYNFTKFVEWPAGSWRTASAPVDVCVLGPDPFGEVLDQTLEGKAIDSHALQVRRLTDLGSLQGCAVVFVSVLERNELAAVLDRLRGRPILTVGDGYQFAEAGGMIGMFIEDNHVRFAINPEAADGAHLAISSRLLNLARIVHTTRKGPS